MSRAFVLFLFVCGLQVFAAEDLHRSVRMMEASPNTAQLVTHRFRAESQRMLVCLELLPLPKYRLQKNGADHELSLQAEADRILAGLGRENEKREAPLKVFRMGVSGFLANLTPSEAQRVAKMPGVTGVYPDMEVRASLDESVPLIGADQVWAEVGPSGLSLRGDGVVIAILDTGVDYRHPDLGGCLGEDCKVIGGYDWVNNDSDPLDDHGHGTHVAGIATGNGAASAGQYQGVAPHARILAHKVLNKNGVGYSSDIIAAIERAMDPNGDGNTEDHVDIINLSLGGPGWIGDPLTVTVDAASAAGVLVVTAAGNEARSQTIGTPALAATAIAVGATTHRSSGVQLPDQLSWFSSRGPAHGLYHTQALKPDLVAPGGDVCVTDSCLNEGDSAIHADGVMAPALTVEAQQASYRRWSGTSMASPHVAGAAALLKQAHPEWQPEKLKSALMMSAVDLGLPREAQGSGRVDVAAALKLPLIVEPAILDFGQVELGSIAKLDLKILNPGEQVISIQLNPTESACDVSVSPSVETLELLPHEAKTVTFTLQFVSNTGLLQAVCSGTIHLGVKDKSFELPFSYYREILRPVGPFDSALGEELMKEFSIRQIYALEYLDFDLDGDKDIVINGKFSYYGDFFNDEVRLLRKEGSGWNQEFLYAPPLIRTSDKAVYSGYEDSSIGMTLADFDGDGLTDIGIGGVQGIVQILYNRSNRSPVYKRLQIKGNESVTFEDLSLRVVEWHDSFALVEATSLENPRWVRWLGASVGWASEYFRHLKISTISYSASESILDLEVSKGPVEASLLGQLGQTAYDLVSFDDDGDGDLDLFSCFSREGIVEIAIARFENRGAREFGNGQVLFSNSSLNNRISSFEVFPSEKGEAPRFLIGYNGSKVFPYNNYSILRFVEKGASGRYQLASSEALRLGFEVDHGDWQLVRINPRFASADFDGDGDLDLAMGDNSGKVAYIENQAGVLKYIGDIYDYGRFSWGLAACDMNGDRKADLVIAAESNDGAGSLHLHTTHTGRKGSKFSYRYALTELPRQSTDKLGVTLVNPSASFQAEIEIVAFDKGGQREHQLLSGVQVPPLGRLDLSFNAESLDGGQYSWAQLGASRDMLVSWTTEESGKKASIVSRSVVEDQIIVSHLAKNTSLLESIVTVVSQSGKAESCSLVRLPGGAPQPMPEFSMPFAISRNIGSQFNEPIQAQDWAMVRSEGKGISGVAFFQYLPQGDFAAFPLSSAKSRTLILPMCTKEETWSGLVIVNPSEFPSEVEESYFDVAGQVLAKTSYSLRPWEKRVLGLWTLDPAVLAQGSSLKISSQKELSGFMIFARNDRQGMVCLPAAFGKSQKLAFAIEPDSLLKLVSASEFPSNLRMLLRDKSGKIIAESRRQGLAPHMSLLIDPRVEFANVIEQGAWLTIESGAPWVGWDLRTEGEGPWNSLPAFELPTPIGIKRKIRLPLQLEEQETRSE